MKQLLTIAFVLAFSLPPLWAQDSNLDPAFKADIVRLLKASGGDSEVLGQAETLTDELIAPVKVVRTDISEDRFAEIKQEIMAFVKEELGGEDSIYDVLIPIYAKYYTHDEVKALADFYTSPLGQKSLEVTPLISAESKSAYESLSQQFLPMIAVQLQLRLQ